MSSEKPRIKRIREFRKVPDTSITNEYATTKNAIKAPHLMLVVGTRNTGKSFTTAKIMHQAVDDKLYDRIFMISPTYSSNRQYWSFMDIDEDDVLYPTRDSIDKIIEKVEGERDEWDAYMVQKKLFKEFQTKTKNRASIQSLNIRDLNMFIDAGFLNEDGEMTEFEPPRWKREIERPCQSCLICDDVLGTPALNNAPGLTTLAIRNRHIAPLTEPFKQRAALGISCIFLSQTYIGGGGGGQGGLPRGLRENSTHLIFFKNKSEHVMKKIMEELAGAVDPAELEQAFEIAIKEKHDNLMIDLFPKCATKQYRRNLTDFIIFPTAECQCGK